MAFILDFTVTHTTLVVAGTPVPVRVDWTFFDEVPPRVELYWRGTGAGADPFGPFPFATGGSRTGQGIIQIPAGTLVDVGVCPRQLDATGTPTQRTQPRDGEAEYWDNFMVWKPRIAIPAKEPPNQGLPIPVITDATPGRGSIELVWTHPGCDFFELRAGPASGLPYPGDARGSDRRFIVPRVGSGRWRISIRAGWRGILGDRRSGWASIEVDVAAAQAWQPWTGGVPGKPVAVGWQQALDRPIALHIARDGRPHVSWPIGFGGWAEPAPIGPPGTVPPGGGIAVVQQAPSVVTAIAIGEDRRLTTWHADDTDPWEGPGAFGPADFPPGGAVALARQAGDVTVAAAVDGAGAVRIAWVEGTGAWRDPVAITAPGFTQPGASVALARLADDLLALLVVAGDGALHIAWVDGVGAWNPPAPISPPREFEPMAGLGLSGQGMDIGVAMAMSREAVPRLSFSQAKGQWTQPPGAIGAAAASPVAGGLGLGQTSLDTLAALWADGNGALEAAGVVTGSPWSAGKVVLPAGVALPGSAIGMAGWVAAFVDPAGRLAIVQVQGAGSAVWGPVLA